MKKFLITILFIFGFYESFSMDNGILWGKFSLPDISGNFLFSPDGKYFLNFNYCVLTIHDALTGEIINIIPNICIKSPGLKARPGFHIFINNSDSLFVSFADVHRIYEIPSGKLLNEITFFHKYYIPIGFSNDAKYMVEALVDSGYNKTLNQFIISDMKNQSIIYTDSVFTKLDTSNGSYFVFGLNCYSPDSKYFSLWSFNSIRFHFSVYDFENKRMIWHDNFDDNDGDVIRTTFINKENQLIIVGMRNLYVLDFLKDTILHVLNYPQKYSPSPRPAFLFQNDNCVLLDYYYIFNYKTGQFTDSVFFYDIEKKIPYKVNDWMSFGGFCISSSDSLALYSYGGYIYEFGTYSKKLIDIVGGGFNEYDDIKLIIKPKFINNDSELSVTGNMGTAIWDSKTGKVKYHCSLYTNQSYGTDVEVMSGKKEFIYFIGYNLIFYDFQNDSIRKIKSFDYNFEKVAVSNNDRYLGLLTDHRNYLLYDIERDTTVIFDICNTDNASIYFSQNSKYFIASDSVNTFIWSLDSNKKIKEISTGYINNKITNDGKYLIGRKAIYDYPSEKDNLTVINPLLQSGKSDYIVKKELQNTDFHIDFCIMSNNKSIVACFPGDSSIKVLNIETGEVVKSFNLENFLPERIALSNNEEYLASLERKENMLVWDFKKLMVSVNPDEAQIFKGSSNPSFFEKQNKGLITLTYNLSEYSKVSITVFDLLGQVIYSTIDDNVHAPGLIKFDIDANCFKTGVYFYQIKSDSQIEKGKFIKYW